MASAFASEPEHNMRHVPPLESTPLGSALTSKSNFMMDVLPFMAAHIRGNLPLG